VRCIDHSTGVFDKIGEVMQIIHFDVDKFYLDINFGRKVIRLSIDQVEPIVV